MMKHVTFYDEIPEALPSDVGVEMLTPAIYNYQGIDFIVLRVYNITIGGVPVRH